MFSIENKIIIILLLVMFLLSYPTVAALGSITNEIAGFPAINDDAAVLEDSWDNDVAPVPVLNGLNTPAAVTEGSGLGFNGVNSYVTFGNSADFNTPSFTVEVMYIPTNLSGCIFTKWAWNSDFFLKYSGAKLKWNMNKLQQDNITSVSNVQVGVPYHVIITSNNINQYMYFNGALEGQDKLYYSRIFNSSPLELGRDGIQNDDYCNMQVLCFAYYQEYWDAATVANRYANFNKTVIPSSKCVLFVNDLNVGYNGEYIVQDLSGKNHHGIAHNITWESDLNPVFYNFSFDQQLAPAWINSDERTIHVAVEAGTDLTDLVADFTMSAGASVAVDGIPQISGVTVNDFSAPVTYTVTAADGSTSAWVVTVDTERGFFDKFVASLGQAAHCLFFGDPVNVATGNFIDKQTDITIPALGEPLEFTRSYNSMEDTAGALGQGWQHNYEEALTIDDDDSVTVRYADGKTARFTEEQGVYLRPEGTFEQLAPNPDGSFTLTFKDQTKHIFDAAGKLIQLVDKNNNTTTLTYNNGLLAQVSDSASRSLLFAYDGSDRLDNITDPINRTVSFTYDPEGNLASVTDLNGETTTYAYDSHGLTTTTDPLGHIILRNTYDSESRVIEQEDGCNNLSSYSYDLNKHQTTVTDGRGSQVRFTYDQYYRIYRTDYPENLFTYTTYDQDHNKISETDANGNITQYTYDSNGNMLTKTDPAPLGYVSTNVYDSFNNLTESTDAAGNLSIYTYDTPGNLLSVTNAVYGPAAVTTFDYNPQGLISSVTNPNNETTAFTYDNYGNVLTTTDPLDHTTTFTYDNAGRKLSKTDPRDKTWTYTHDAKGNLLTEQDPLENTITYVYDAAGNLISKTDAKDQTTTYEYDENYRLIKTTDPLNNFTLVEYDANDNKTGVTDARGNKTTYVYDARNRLISMTDPEGFTESYALDANGNILEKTDKRGNMTTFEYDVLNRLTQTTDSLEGVTQFQYDALGNQTTRIDAENRTTAYTYDYASRLLSVSEPLNKTTSYTYDLAGNKTSMTNAAGDTWEYGYDANNRLITETDPLDNLIQTGYDPAGNVSAKTDARGKTTTYEYDDRGLLTAVNAPLGQTTLYSYDANGNRTSVTDANNHTTTYEFDGNNRLTKTTGPDNKSETYTLDANGNILQKEDRKSGITTYEYDKENRVVEITDPLDGITGMQYDANGNRTQVTDPNNKQYTYTYDELNRQNAVTDPENQTTYYTYDLVGNVLTMTDATNASWEYTYDDLNRLTETTDPLNHSTQTDYDAVGNITAKTDANGNTTVYDYDPRGLMVSVTDAKDGLTLYGYDANGNLIAVTDANGHTRTFEYDDLNSQIKETDAQDQEKITVYDAAGNRTERTQPNGDTILYGYDENNRLTQITYPDTTEVTYTYDDLGARTAMTDSHGTTTYTYDALNRLETVSRNGQTASYDYDPAGNITQITYPNGTQVDYTYNGLNLPLTAAESGQLISIAYDTVGRRSGEELPNDIDVTYQYDLAGRLTLIDHQQDNVSLAKSAYIPDPNGNRLSKTDESGLVTSYDYDELNQLTQALYPNGRTVEYSYDAAGNRTDVTDSQVQTPDTQTKDYIYDYENRLIQYQDDNQTITYNYDGDGNLIERTVTEGTNTDTYEYFYDYSAGLPRLLVETKNETETYNYIYAGRLLARKGPEGKVYYHQDGLGSTLAITDWTGQVLNKYTYDAYGEVTSSQESVYNSILFTGEMQDQSGLIYLRARYYDPTSGRFTVEDTLFGDLENPLTQNLYAYCLNNPVNYVDPSGHTRKPAGQLLENGASYLGGFSQAILDNLSLNLIKGAEPEDYRNLESYLSGKQAGHVLVMLLAQSGKAFSMTIAPGNTLVAAPSRVGTISLGIGLLAAGNAVRDEVMYSNSNEGAGNAFDVAKSGGKHSGFYKQYINKSKDEISKGIKSIDKQIAEHQNKIANPESHIPNFKNLDPRQQEALINKKWPSDIQRQIEQKEILEGILRSK